jgi:hypothetical protein
VVVIAVAIGVTVTVMVVVEPVVWWWRRWWLKITSKSDIGVTLDQQGHMINSDFELTSIYHQSLRGSEVSFL